MASFHCEVVTPTSLLFEGEVSYAEIPGALGSFGVMSGHEKIVATNREGLVRLTLGEGGEKRAFAVHGGVTQMVDDRLIVMAREGCAVEDIDVEAIRSKEDGLRAEIAELEGRVAGGDDAARATLDVRREHLAWYETQTKISEGQPV